MRCNVFKAVPFTNVTLCAPTADPNAANDASHCNRYSAGLNALLIKLS